MTANTKTGTSVSDLDLETLGATLRMMPVISRRAGHNSAQATLDYGAPSTPGAAFIRDVFSMKTQDVISKWYGEGAADKLERGAAEEVSAMISAHRKRPTPL
jgi:hypothetical protein